MTPARGFWAQWYFSVPDLVLWALMYGLVAYAILSLVLRADNIVLRTLAAAVSPAVAPLAAIAPRLVPRSAVAVYALGCVYVIRIALFIAAQTIR